MINITRADCKVYITFNTGFNIDKPVIPCVWTSNTEVDACALARIMRDELEARIHSIREHAYNQGVADARAKRKLKKQFCVTTDNAELVGW